MKNKILIFISLLVVITIGTSFLRPSNTTIAVLLPITGDASVYGESAKNAALLAAKELPKHIKVQIEDTNLKGTQTISAYQKMSAQSNVSTAISFSTGETVALCPITEKDRVLLLSSGSSPSIAACGPNTYSNFPSDEYQGTILAKRVNQEKIAIVYIKNDYGMGVANQFKKEYKGSVLELPHLPGSTDTRDSILKLRESNIQDIVLISQPKEAAIFLKEASETDMKFNSIFASESLKDISFIKHVPVGYRTVFTTIAPKTHLGVEHAEFVKKYADMFKNNPAAYADYVYDNILLAGKVIDRCRKDTSCINSYMKKLNEIGTTGTIYFGDFHSVQNKEYGFYKIAGNDFSESAI